MVILAKSKKYNNYCVACYDYKLNSLVRLVTTDNQHHNAVSKDDLLFDNLVEAQVGDIVSVEVLCTQPAKCQPENLLIDTGKYLKRLGECFEYHSFLTNPNFIFWSTSKKIAESELEKISVSNSIEFINVKNSIVRVKYWDKGPKVTLDFYYRGKEYRYFNITDTSFNNGIIRYSNNKDIEMKLDDVFLIISLGEVYDYDQCRYKLIASIIENDFA